MSREAVNYYLSILERNRLSFPIQRLVGYRGQASAVVQNVAKNEEELAVFLKSYPGIFKIENNTVMLHPNYRYELDRKSAVYYYSNFVAQCSPCLGLSIDNLFGHRGQAPSDVSVVANNPLELRELLLDHPETFIINNDTVFLTDSDELIEKAVHYYSNLLTKISPNKEIPIERLIGYKSKAPLSIKHVAKNKKEFIRFFSCHPNVFTVIKNMYVTLNKAPSNNNPINRQTFFQESNENIALEYYLNILSRISPNNDCPITRLIGHRGQAPCNVQLVAKNKKELAIFLRKYPNTFTLCQNNEYVRLAKSVNTGCTLAAVLPNDRMDKVTACTSAAKTPNDRMDRVTACTLTAKSPNDGMDKVTACILAAKSPNDRVDRVTACSLAAKTPNDWMDKVTACTLAAKSPNDRVDRVTACSLATKMPNDRMDKVTACTLADKSLNDRVDRVTACSLAAKSPNDRMDRVTACSLAALSPNDWMDRVLKSTTIIDGLVDCQNICRMILKEKVIALDCEGVNLGYGTISIIQIGLFSGEIYLFDICEELMINGGLIRILESDNILKIVNYCVNDSMNLLKQFAVLLNNVFDVSVAYHVIENNASTLSHFKPVGLNDICKKYGVPLNNCKDGLKNIYKSNPYYWLTRPMTKKMVAYAAQDVASLPYLYKKLLNCLDSRTEYVVKNVSQKLCRKPYTK